MKQTSFLPEPEFCPILPPVHSVAYRCLADLLERELTHLDWIQEGKGWRLSAAVKELDYLGWEPTSIRVKCQGWTRPIARYGLSLRAKQAAAALHQGGNHAYRN